MSQNNPKSNESLQADDQLENSCIVANCRMNRERVALGTNGYQSDLLFDPIEFLIQKHRDSGQADWLDLCCGRGRALIQAAQKIREADCHVGTLIQGIDLIDMFDPLPTDFDFLEFEVASLHNWTTTKKFDLITCVHGLHYIGDKLGLIKRAADWLRPGGRFAANLDLSNLRSRGQTDFGSLFVTAGMDYSAEKHLLSFDGRAVVRDCEFFSTDQPYLGADDQAGPNYTGQEAVNSYYA